MVIHRRRGGTVGTGRPGTKHFHHPRVGDLTLGYQSMQLEGTPGHRLVAYYADPASPDHDAMVLLDMLGTRHAPEICSPKQRHRAAKPGELGVGSAEFAGAAVAADEQTEVAGSLVGDVGRYSVVVAAPLGSGLG
ncbi:MmyB family transcriptional regulator [Streptomyces cynarae]|uniref:MmyB family transcriptional regulator n=1 Tax=Streptomyces cynarae TaxID=2981134 RepID=UPI0036F340E6